MHLTAGRNEKNIKWIVGKRNKKDSVYYIEKYALSMQYTKKLLDKTVIRYFFQYLI